MTLACISIISCMCTDRRQTQKFSSQILSPKDVYKILETVAIYIPRIFEHTKTFFLFSLISVAYFWVVPNVENYLTFSKFYQKASHLSDFLSDLSKYLTICDFI